MAAIGNGDYVTYYCDSYDWRSKTLAFSEKRWGLRCDVQLQTAKYPAPRGDSPRRGRDSGAGIWYWKISPIFREGKFKYKIKKRK